MPPSHMSVVQAQTIVAYLRASAASRRAGAVAGDAARGRTVFDGKGALLRAVAASTAMARASAQTSTGIGTRRGALELERSLVDVPARRSIRPAVVQVMLKDGTCR